jgi:hypothetical protein
MGMNKAWLFRASVGSNFLLTYVALYSPEVNKVEVKKISDEGVV